MQLKKRKITLTKREHLILDLVSRGYTNKEIGEQLKLKLPTVSTSILNMLRKTDCINRTSLVRWGFERGLLQISGD